MSIISFIISIAVLILVLKLISLPFKLIIKFVLNSIAGGLVLMFLSFLGIGITVTGLMVVLTGLLGIPGLLIAIVISFLF